MDESKLRSALRVIASDPEPPTTVDVAAARSRGRRRQRVRHVVAPVAVALAVAAAAIIPYSVLHAAPRPALPPAAPTPAQAPSAFNPLVPYAAFGWLPKGFSETLEPPDSLLGMYSGADLEWRAAWSPGHRSVTLGVQPRGACQSPADQGPADLTGYWGGRSCKMPLDPAPRQLPPVNGRPAMTISGGIAWEYAPDAWALLTTDGGTSSGRRIPALSRAELYQVASRVVFGARQPIYFPFRLAGGLPPGWQMGGIGFRASGTRLLFEQQFPAGPASRSEGDYALYIDVAGGYPVPVQGPCTFTAGRSSYVTRDGVRWITTPASADGGSTICVANPDPRAARTGVPGRVDGLQVFISSDPSGPLGDALSVLGRLTLLGPDPATWTDRPLG